MKKYLFLLIIFFIPNVFAQDFNVNSSDVSSPNSSGTGKYTGTEIYNSGTSNVYNIGTRYNGQLSRIIFNLASGGYADPDGFEKGHTYTLSLNMATDDWRNKFGSVSVKCEGSSGTELSNGRVNYISYRKISFSFTAPSDRYCQFVYVDLKSSNITSTAFTGVSNWNLSSMVITDPYYCTDCGSSSNPTPTPQPNNQDIINNASQNTNSIINNQNDNTNNIIENNNSNTENITNSINADCKSGPFLVGGGWLSDKDKVLNTDGSLSSSSGNYVSTYVQVLPGTTYSFSFPAGPPGNGFYVCQYGANKQFLDGGCKLLSSLNGNDFVTGNYTNYIRFSYPLRYWYSMIIKGPVCNNWELEAQNKTNDKIDETNQKLDDINSSINNSQIDDKTSFFTNFNNNTHGLTGIITLPLSTIQSLANSSCVSLSLPVPFTNDTFNLPCMTQVYQNSVPDIYSMWQVVSFGIISYYICLDIFKMVKGFKDPNEDKIEVLDL